MRKISASLLAISFFMLIFCGCDRVAEPKELNTVFSSQATVTTEDITMDVEITSSESGDIAINVLSPDSIKGLSYHKVNSTLYIEFDGLKCTTADDYLTKYNPFEVIFDVISSVRETIPECSQNEGGIATYNGTCDKGSYILYADSKSGDILKIVPTYTNCEIEFMYE